MPAGRVGWGKIKVCGLAGIFDTRRPIKPALGPAMCEALSHRGPDDSGLQALPQPGLCLVHRRLSILDLSPLGHQPMASPDGRCWIVYNGEIYNFREVRAELQARGHSFRSDSDTEVILAAYREWGLASVERYRGMFAFALWDSAQQTLHLCRDRFGVKPMFYSLVDGRLYFASEVKALHAVGATGSTVDPVALAEYLQYGYVTAPRSLFANVRCVRPGTIVSFDTKLGTTTHEYWSVHKLFDRDETQALREELSGLDETALLDRVEGELKTAFEYRMVADVPVGLFLSGGIDSSLVAGILAKRSGVRLRTFTIGYQNAEFDETAYARRVAAHLGAEHTEFIVSPDEAIKLFDRIPSIADEPIGDSSIIPTLMVSQLARRHVTVALSADGADELFGGYPRYQVCGQYVERLGSPARTVQWLGAELLDRMPQGWVSGAYSAIKRGKRFAAIDDKLRKFVTMSRAREPFKAYEAAISEWGPEQLAAFGVRSPEAEALAKRDYEASRVIDARTAFMHFDSTRYLTGDLLTKVDRASMAVSLEAREPFLDHEMARVAAALPTHWKIRDGQNKYVLRRLLDRIFEPGLFDRPKQGFSAPIAQWLRGPLRDVLSHELSPTSLRKFGLLDEAGVSRSLNTFLSGGPGVSAAGMWFLLQLQLWAGRWLQPAAKPVAAPVTRPGTISSVA